MEAFRVLGAGVLTLTVLSGPAFGQPSDTPQEILVPPVSHERVAKSDEDRVVGKVLEIDRTQGRVKLSTDEGVQTLPAPPHTLPVIRVGDTISVPRPSATPSALPRQ